MPGLPRVRVGLLVVAGLALLRVATAMNSTAGIVLIAAVTLALFFWSVLGSLPK